MKKFCLVSVSALLLLSSCGTYTGAGAYSGGMFGSIIGSAIGGISGGRHGSNVGTLIGMAGGAAVGAAVGAAADQAQQREYEQYQADRQQRMAERQRNYGGQVQQSQVNYDDQADSGFDPSGSGDDRLYGFGEDFSTTSATKGVTLADLEIRNPRILDASRDGELTRGEEARMVFEIYNCSSEPAYQVLPSVIEVTGNKHIRISENVLVECIRPGKGIRYTAVIKADNRLKDGEAVIKIGVFQGNKEITSQAQEFVIKTSKR